MATKEYFPEIGKIKFEGKDSKNPLAYRYYDAEKVVLGKKMKDWLKFAMAWWHTLCAEGGDQFGGGTKKFPWNEGDAMTVAKQKADAGLKSCRSSESNISVSTIPTLSVTLAKTSPTTKPAWLKSPTT